MQVGTLDRKENKIALSSEKTHCSDGSWHVTLLVTWESQCGIFLVFSLLKNQEKGVMVHQPPTYLFRVLKQRDPVAL